MSVRPCWTAVTLAGDEVAVHGVTLNRFIIRRQHYTLPCNVMVVKREETLFVTVHL